MWDESYEMGVDEREQRRWNRWAKLRLDEIEV